MSLLSKVLPKKMYLKMNLYNDKVWEPFNYGKTKSCEEIETGDYIAIEILDEITDHIYENVSKKDGRMKANRRKLWKVVETYKGDTIHDDIMLQCGLNKILLKYLTWVNDNTVKVESGFMIDGARYSFFKPNI